MNFDKRGRSPSDNQPLDFMSNMARTIKAPWGSLDKNQETWGGGEANHRQRL